jgi:hypothetical protein
VPFSSHDDDDTAAADVDNDDLAQSRRRKHQISSAHDAFDSLCPRFLDAVLFDSNENNSHNTNNENKIMVTEIIHSVLTTFISVDDGQKGW